MLAARIGMTGKLPWMMVSVASSKPKTAIASEGGERAERYSRNHPCETALSKSAINPCSRVNCPFSTMASAERARDQHLSAPWTMKM